MTLIGVGYAGHTVAGFVDLLHHHRVQHVIDVRLSPMSRKPGFGARQLTTTLTGEGIDYTHEPALGNPAPNRSGFAPLAPLAAQLSARRVFRTHLRDTLALLALDRVRLAADTRRVALLCLEQDEVGCHRHVILDRLGTRRLALRDRTDAELTDMAAYEMERVQTARGALAATRGRDRAARAQLYAGLRGLFDIDTALHDRNQGVRVLVAAGTLTVQPLRFPRL